jgi:hypothetical protein
VEALAAYSHSAQAADLRLCHTVALASPWVCPKPSAKRPCSLRDRLDERDIADLLTAYQEGATAHNLSLTGVQPCGHRYRSTRPGPPSGLEALARSLPPTLFRACSKYLVPPV